MKWRDKRQSDNIIDNRDNPRSSAPMGVGLAGVLVLGIAVYALGGDPRIVLSMLGEELNRSTTAQPESSGPQSPFDSDDSKNIASTTLASLEDTWSKIFAKKGLRFQPAPLVLFRGQTETGCGFGQSATGPFYCPADNRIYLDLSFLDQLQALGGRGDFALAYVIAHEMGHHIQTLLHPSQMRGRKSSEESVSTELQADCYAGVWTHYADAKGNFLEAGDIEEGLQAASAVGDDRIQKRTSGVVIPESFTHGSSEQRMAAFAQGYRSGAAESCGES